MRQPSNQIVVFLTCLTISFMLWVTYNYHEKDNYPLYEAVYLEIECKKDEEKKKFSEWAKTIPGGVCGTPLQMELINIERETLEKYDINTEAYYDWVDSNISD